MKNKKRFRVPAFHPLSLAFAPKNELRWGCFYYNEPGNIV